MHNVLCCGCLRLAEPLLLFKQNFLSAFVYYSILFPSHAFFIAQKKKKKKKKKKDLWGLEKLLCRKERGDGKRKHNSLTWLYHIRRHMRHTKKKFTLLSWSFYKVINQLFLFLLDKNFNLISLFFFFFFFVTNLIVYTCEVFSKKLQLQLFFLLPYKNFVLVKWLSC